VVELEPDAGQHHHDAAIAAWLSSRSDVCRLSTLCLRVRSPDLEDDRTWQAAVSRDLDSLGGLARGHGSRWMVARFGMPTAGGALPAQSPGDLPPESSPGVIDLDTEAEHDVTANPDRVHRHRVAARALVRAVDSLLPRAREPGSPGDPTNANIEES
jgi:hypothetical protein